MTDYEVGYGRPPVHTRFKKGVCPNPKGRGKRDSTGMAKIIHNVLSEQVEYREGRQVRRGSRLEAIIRKLFSEAVRGDVSSAAKLLNLREHAETHGDIGTTVIKIGIAYRDV
jgi:Family of unknown function (DUF5681)